MEDNSWDGAQPQVVQPAEELHEETTRQQQQQQGWDKLAKGHRAVIQTALKEPTQANLEALRLLQVEEPKFANAVLKEYGYENLDGYAQAISKKAVPAKEEMLQFMEEYEKQKTTTATKSQIENQLNSLPEAVREIAKAEFTDLVDGRNLTPEQLSAYARKAVTLANAQTGSNFRIGALNLGSSSLSSSNPTEMTDADSFLAEKAKTDPFYALINGK